jgi:hypothetical protein
MRVEASLAPSPDSSDSTIKHGVDWAFKPSANPAIVRKTSAAKKKGLPVIPRTLAVTVGATGFEPAT